MSSRKHLNAGELGDALMFLERVVPRGAAEADRLEYLIGLINRILDSQTPKM